MSTPNLIASHKLIEQLQRENTALRKALDAALQYVDPKDVAWIESLAEGEQ